MVLIGLVVIGYIGILVSNSMSNIPSYVGIKDGRLSPVDKSKPNNLSTYEAGQYPQAEPLTYTGTREEAKARLLNIINNTPRTEVISDDGDYLHVTYKSRLFRFVDDVEFLFDDEEKLIHFRSASRVGYSDMNANQKRMAALSQAFGQ